MPSVSLHILKRSPLYLQIHRFIDSSDDKLVLPSSLSFDEREIAKQIADHFDCRTRQSPSKDLVIFKPDLSHLETEIVADESIEEIERLKDELVNVQLCLSLTQRRLAHEQLKSNTKLDAKDESSDLIPLCSNCEEQKVSHAVFPCAHLYCLGCCEKFIELKKCRCEAIVEGLMLMQSIENE